MSTETVETADPRRPQGAWPLICFVAGLIVAGLISCQPQTGASVPSKAPPPVIKTAAPVAAPAPVVPLPANLSDEMRAILSKLGDTPSAAGCDEAFKDLLALDRIRFSKGSAAFSEKSGATLDVAAAIAGKCKAYAIEIAGHTDRSGPMSVNQRISDKRAEAVKDYLVSKGALAASLTAKGYGETKPINTGKGRRAAAQNRRIEFAVTAKS